MSDAFNPYHKWLGIPPEEQPADHYRLLGVAQLESDADVITGASDQRMQFLLTMQTGEHSKLVDKLLNEIANAKVCLLNKEKKAAYDKRLRTKTAVEEKRQESTAKPPFKVDAKTTTRRRDKQSSPPSTGKDARETESSRRLVPIIALAVVAMAIIGGIFFYFIGEANKREEQRLAQVAEEAAADKAAKEEADRKAEEEADRRLKEAERRAKDAEQKLEQEAERRKEEAKRKEKEEARRKAQEEAARKAKEETERKRKEAKEKARAAREARVKAAKEAAKRAERKASSAAKPEKRVESLKQRKEQKEAIVLLQAKGLKRGKNGWAPQDMLKQLTDLKKEVAALETDELTPEQKVQVKQLMERYYEEKFVEWTQLRQKGLSRAVLQGLELGSVSLPTLEFKQYRHLKTQLLAPLIRGEEPKIQPSNVMQEEARFASLRVLTKQNPQYLNQANVQRKKKQKQIKALKKKIRGRIRSLEKNIEVQQVLAKLGGKLDTTFISQE